MKDCVFCKITNKEIPSEFLFESDDFVVIKDIYPKAKTHLLIIPKKHLVFDKLTEDQAQTLSNGLIIAKQVAKKLNIKNGFRLIINNGKDSGQEIEHLHIHLLAGQKLKF